MAGMPAPLPGSRDVLETRSNSVRDIFHRAGVISPDRIHIRNLPVEHPASAFNPGLSFEESSGCLVVYPRIVLGYYMYVSSIASFRLCLDDIAAGRLGVGRFMADVVLSPDNRYDIWGAEDPRVYALGDGRLYMTYTGRSINYFEPRRWEYRTRPVTAAYMGEGWVKLAVHTPDHNAYGGVVSDKNAFLHRSPSGTLLLFHRVHNRRDEFKLLVSPHPSLEAGGAGGAPREYTVGKGWLVDIRGPWESKLGWAAPPIHVGGSRYLLLVHAVDREGVVYRVLAVEMDLGDSIPRLTAVTPDYIMEPREPYERIGDRPHVVFPCGAVRVDDDLIISYGAADLYVGVARVGFDDLLAELDRGRVE